MCQSNTGKWVRQSLADPKWIPTNRQILVLLEEMHNIKLSLWTIKRKLWKNQLWQRHYKTDEAEVCCDPEVLWKILCIGVCAIISSVHVLWMFSPPAMVPVWDRLQVSLTDWMIDCVSPERWLVPASKPVVLLSPSCWGLVFVKMSSICSLKNNGKGG